MGWLPFGLTVLATTSARWRSPAPVITDSCQTRHTVGDDDGASEGEASRRTSDDNDDRQEEEEEEE